MSVLQRKIRNYLDLKRDLESQYKSVIKSTSDSNTGLQDLYEFDQLCYLYYALKSYYDISRSNWDLDYRNLLDDLASIVLRMEDKIPIADILAQAPKLTVVRRQLRENAKEGGKVAFSMVLLNADMESFRLIVMSLDLNQVDVDSSSLRQLSLKAETSEQQGNTASTTSTSGQPVPPKHHPTQPQTTTPRASKQQRQTEEALPTAQTAPQPKGTLPGAVVPLAVQHTNQQTPQTSRYSPNNKRTPGSLSQPSPSLQKPTAFASQKRPTVLDSSPQKRPKQVFFTHLNDWTPEHVQCVFRCAIMAPHRVSESIQEGFEKSFNIKISLEAAHALQLHYGILPETMNDYKYYMQSFHTVASKFFANRQHYVTEPWAELKKLFLRKTNLLLSDDDVKGRYELFILHRQTYGPQGEPPLYYENAWNEFKRIHSFRQSQQKDTGKSFFASANENQGGALRNAIASKPRNPIFWSIRATLELVRAQATIAATKPGRILEVQKHLRAAGFDFSLEEIITKLSERGVMNSINDLQRMLEREQLKQRQLGQHGLNVIESQGFDISGAQRTPSLPETQAPSSKAPSSQPVPTPQTQPAQSISTTATTGLLRNKPDVPSAISASQVSSTQAENKSPQADSVKQPAASSPTARSPSSDSDLPKGVRRVSANVGQKPNHFDNLIAKVTDAVRPNWHYLNRFKNLPVTAFWDFDKNLTITSTVDHISQISENTQNPTERVARANLIKLIMLRFLRKHLIIVTEEYLEARLIKMMEKDVFDAAACRLINDQIMKK